MIKIPAPPRRPPSTPRRRGCPWGPGPLPRKNTPGLATRPGPLPKQAAFWPHGVKGQRRSETAAPLLRTGASPPLAPLLLGPSRGPSTQGHPAPPRGAQLGHPVLEMGQGDPGSCEGVFGPGKRRAPGEGSDPLPCSGRVYRRGPGSGGWGRTVPRAPHGPPALDIGTENHRQAPETLQRSGAGGPCCPPTPLREGLYRGPWLGGDEGRPPNPARDPSPLQRALKVTEEFWELGENKLSSL